MNTLSTTEAHERFSELLRRVASDKERVVLTRAGEELVAIVPVEDLALVEALEDRADLEDAREALREAREKGTTSLADLKAELGL
jgi:prevent-host-death family protein